MFGGLVGLVTPSLEPGSPAVRVHLVTNRVPQVPALVMAADSRDFG